jgi:hypothetical protein
MSELESGFTVQKVDKFADTGLKLIKSQNRMGLPTMVDSSEHR